MATLEALQSLLGGALVQSTSRTDVLNQCWGCDMLAKLFDRLLAAAAVFLSIGVVAAVANYAVTQGSGTTFGSVVVGGVHYAQQFICDLTTPSQCASVSAGGAVSTSAAQSGTWNVTNVSGTVSLPTGASTAAKQPALGTAGTASTDVLTVQGIASMTPLLATVTNTNANGSATSANSSPVVIASDQVAVAVKAASGAFASGSHASGAFASGAFASGSIASGAMVDLGAQADTVCATNTGTCSQIALIKRGNANTQGPYPNGATAYTATATGTTGATTATLAGAASVTTYLCGFSIRANATAAATGNATVTGVITATLNFTQWTAPNASGLGITEMIFAPCIPASGTNQSVAVVSAAPGTGGVVSVTAWGYKL